MNSKKDQKIFLGSNEVEDLNEFDEYDHDSINDLEGEFTLGNHKMLLQKYRSALAGIALVVVTYGVLNVLLCPNVIDTTKPFYPITVFENGYSGTFVFFVTAISNILQMVGTIAGSYLYVNRKDQEKKKTTAIVVVVVMGILQHLSTRVMQNAQAIKSSNDSLIL